MADTENDPPHSRPKSILRTVAKWILSYAIFLSLLYATIVVLGYFVRKIGLRLPPHH